MIDDAGVCKLIVPVIWFNMTINVKHQVPIDQLLFEWQQNKWSRVTKCEGARLENFTSSSIYLLNTMENIMSSILTLSKERLQNKGALKYTTNTAFLLYFYHLIKCNPEDI